MKQKSEMFHSRAASLVRRVAQQWLSDGATIEDLFGVAIDAARAEWACRIVCTKPLELLIDGRRYQWPTGSGDDDEHEA